MAQQLLNIEIVSIKRTVYTGTARSLVAHTVDGQITILPHHEPLITLLDQGELDIRTESGEELYFALSSGFLEIRPNKIIILVEDATRAEDIDEASALAARKRAEELIRTRNEKDDMEFADAKALLAKSLLELKVVGRKKSLRTHTPPLREE